MRVNSALELARGLAQRLRDSLRARAALQRVEPLQVGVRSACGRASIAMALPRQITMSSARSAPASLERLEDRHEVARRGADLVHGPHDLVEADAGVEHEHAAGALLDVDVRCAATTTVSPLRANAFGWLDVDALRDA